MKKNYYSFFAIIFCCLVATSQPAGQWTWMKGDNLFSSQAAVYGTKGVAAVTNTPGAYYESCEWKDTAGNFWLFGGLAGNEFGDLWKFDPLTTNWTWMNGPGVPAQQGNYGTQGVPSPTNQPGCRAWGVVSLTGKDGKFWMFGGWGYAVGFGTGLLNDLWSYDVASGEWTWVSGSNTLNAVGVYGTMGIPSPTNVPGGRCEINTGWVDSTGNLWFFGGYSSDYNDLWKFDINTLEWTWMQGSNTTFSTGNYGTKGVASPTNEPPGRYVYGRWKDLQGNFWFFGGNSPLGEMNDLWKYDLATNEWTWVNGPNTGNDIGASGALCAADSTYRPPCKFENRAAWVDRCGNFYNFGGYHGGTDLNDFWQYNPVTDRWRLITGTTNVSSSGNYGTLGVSSATNIPPSRFGADAWTDANGNFWMFGGRGTASQLNDVWRYVLDTVCLGISCSTSCALHASFTSSDTAFCDEAGKCINFFDQSTCNPTSWHWSFPGAAIDTSSQQNPTNICYYYTGTYPVTLIVSNSTSTDTLVVSPHIIFATAPPPPTVTVVGGDTLYSSHEVGYQWYRNGVLIAGATDSFYVVIQSGTYAVQGTDSLGCYGLSNGVFITGLASLTYNAAVTLYPNPASDELMVAFDSPLNKNIEVIISTMIGQELDKKILDSSTEIHSLSLKELDNGIYMLQLRFGDQTVNKKFVVLHK